MTLYLDVEALPPDADERDVVYVAADVLTEAEIAPGDIIQLTSQRDRSRLARVETLEAGGDGAGRVRMGETLRESLKVTFGDTVEVEKAAADELSSVTLAPLSDVSGIEEGEIADYVRTVLSQEKPVINEGEVRYVTLPGGEFGTGFKVLECRPSGGYVGEGTTVEIEFVFSTWGVEEETTFDDIGGLDEEIQKVRELIEFPIRFPDVFQRLGVKPSSGVILFGPPGTGKTLMTRSISNELDAGFFYINGPSVISTGYGETEQQIREVFAKARKSLPAIVFIDELDAIAPKREQTGSLADLRVVSQLLELMDGIETVPGVVVVGTTNRIDSLDPALRRPGRFDREVYIGPPDAEERTEILGIHTRGALLDSEVAEYLPELAERLHGYTGADIMELVREAGVTALRREIGSRWSDSGRRDLALSNVRIGKGDFDRALGVVQPSVLREAISPPERVSLSRVGGLAAETERLVQLLTANHGGSPVFAEMKIRGSPGILLHGPPGTGKSLLAKAVGNSFDATVLQVDSSEVFSQWVGESEKSLKRIFRIARRSSPSIVLIDNVDVLIGSPGDATGGQVAGRVKNQFLQEIDRLSSDMPDRGVTVIGTTNQLEEIDRSFLSPNRFGERIEFGLPDPEARREILSLYIGDVPNALSPEDEDRIVSLIEGYTGADIERLCQRAKLAAIEETEYERAKEVTVEHFLAALEE